MVGVSGLLVSCCIPTAAKVARTTPSPTYQQWCALPTHVVGGAVCLSEMFLSPRAMFSEKVFLLNLRCPLARVYANLHPPHRARARAARSTPPATSDPWWATCTGRSCTAASSDTPGTSTTPTVGYIAWAHEVFEVSSAGPPHAGCTCGWS